MRHAKVEWITEHSIYRDLYFFGRKVFVSVGIGLQRRGKCGSCGK